MPQINATDTQELIGKRVMVPFGNGQVECVIRDVKFVYGSTRYDVELVNGSGRKWINADRARLVE